MPALPEFKMSGMDSIVPLKFSPPQEIMVPLPHIYQMEMTKQMINQHYLAAMWYCFSCRQPLDIHYNTIRDGRKLIFSCPTCGRKWFIDDKPTTT